MISAAASLCVLVLSIAPLSPPGLPTQDGSRFGRAVLVLDDLDGDGVPEIAVGAPTAAAQKGRVVVLSGESQELLQVWSGPSDRTGFGHFLRSIQDVNADGIDDLLVGFEYWARTELRSGKDGATIHTFDRAFADVVPMGDFDGDGAGDLILTTFPFWEVRSGRSNALLNGRTWVESKGRFDPVGDIDGDGLVDGVYFGKEPTLMLSARPKAGDLALIQLYERDSCTPLKELWPDVLGAEGVATSRAVPAGDLDGDGEIDLLVATHRGKLNSVLGLSLAKPSSALLRVSNPNQLWANDSIGYSMLGGVDLSGDLVHDVAFALPPGPFYVGVMATPGTMEAEPSGPNAKGALWTAKWPDGGGTSGATLAAYVDRDGDDVSDILVGTSDWYWHGRVNGGGALRLVSGASGKDIWTVTEDRYGEALRARETPK